MLSIGDFARYAGVSVRMLRHYDALGLLVPAEVDPVTGYRRYRASQLSRLNRLVALKDLGFTLQQLGPVLDAEVGVEELRGMLRLRRAEVAEQLAADRARLDAIERRLRMIEKEGTMSEQEYVEKELPAVRLAQLTDRVEDVSAIGARIGPMFDRLARELPAVGLSIDQPGLAWYEPDGDGMRFGAGWPTGTDTVPVPEVEVAELAAVPRAVTVLHRGSMETIQESWQALGRYLDTAGLQPSGPCREVYLHVDLEQPDEWVTELQQPVA